MEPCLIGILIGILKGLISYLYTTNANTEILDLGGSSFDINTSVQNLTAEQRYVPVGT